MKWLKSLLALLRINTQKAEPKVCKNTYPAIDWSDPKAKISKHFTVGEALYLPSWGVSHTPTPYEQESIVKLAEILDKVRDLYEKPIIVHVWIRPTSAKVPGSPHDGKDYNAHIRGAKRSAHIPGMACDFHVKGVTCKRVRHDLRKKLEQWGLRMEDHRGNWVHLDCRSPGPGGRFFKP